MSYDGCAEAQSAVSGWRSYTERPDLRLEGGCTRDKGGKGGVLRTRAASVSDAPGKSLGRIIWPALNTRRGLRVVLNWVRGLASLVM